MGRVANNDKKEILILYSIRDFTRPIVWEYMIEITKGINYKLTGEMHGNISSA